jgi:hypothetical protein
MLIVQQIFRSAHPLFACHYLQIKLHGGVERAGNIIETVAQFGLDIFLTADENYSMYAKYNLLTLFIYISTRIFKCISYRLKSVTKCASETKEKTN